jgi:SPP1 family phage portal protein
VTIDEIIKRPVSEQITLLQTKKDIPEYATLESQYDIDGHAVFDALRRPNKEVTRSTGRQTAAGEEVTETTTETVNRIGIPFQRLIVNRAVGFLLGDPVTMKSNADTDRQQLLQEMVERTLHDNKAEYFDRKLSRTVKSQCEAAELWYLVEDRTFWKRTLKESKNNIYKLRVKLLSPSAGDKLYPYFDETGDMVAFSRVYQITDSENKVTEHFDTWTEILQVARVLQNGEWLQTVAINPLGKIPVIYYTQEEPEWAAVQTIIDRYETKISNFADTNDYFGSPMVVVEGDVTKLPDKTTQGKTIQVGQGGSVNYLSWDQSPESEKLEFEQLEKQIYSMTQTPNISFDQMKSLGGDMSGFAIKLLFTDAHMKAANDIELYGEMFTRRLNLIKHVCGTVINVALASEVDFLELVPEFHPFLPQNVKEEIEILSTARAGKPLISQKTAIEKNPLAVSVDEEIARMGEDAEADAQLSTRELTGAFV